MKCIYYLLLMLCPYVSGAQAPIGIGERLPPTTISAHNKGRSEKIAAEIPSGRFTILNFMASYCGSCIAALPIMEKLQRKYKGKLDIYLLSEETPKKLKQWAAVNKINLPFLQQAVSLRTYFPYEYISHLVWLSPQGEVLAITGKEYLTEFNVELALSGKPLPWPVKRDYAVAPPSHSLVDEGLKPVKIEQNNTGYSAAFAYAENLPTHFQFSLDSASGKSQIRLLNKPLLYWYGIALNAKNWPLSQIAVYDSNRDAYHFNATRFYKAAWDRSFCFSYESIATNAESKTAHALRLLEFANDFFGLKVIKKDSLVHSWVLRETGNTEAFSKKNSRSQVEIQNLVTKLNNRFGFDPVVDGRIHKTALYIDLPEKLPDDISSLNTLLKRYCLQLVSGDSCLPMLIFYRTRERTFLSSNKTYIK